MSRSYKKVPCVKDHSGYAKSHLRESKRRIRHTSVDVDIPSGGFWKKNAKKWDICDWKITCSWSRYCRDTQKYHDEYINGIAWSRHEDYSLNRNYRDWYTRYKRK